MTVPYLRHVSRALGIALALFAMSGLADPPDHAKAHGWRKKNDPRYVGYTGRAWERDYGIVTGSCNRKEIGTVLGAVVGGAIGSQVGDGDGRPVAIVVGAVLGAVIGREIGADLDDGDRACIGHALELGEPGHGVRWLNERTGVSYLVTPLAASDADKNCRKFSLKTTHKGQSRVVDSRACRAADGRWAIATR